MSLPWEHGVREVLWMSSFCGYVWPWWLKSVYFCAVFIVFTSSLHTLVCTSGVFLLCCPSFFHYPVIDNFPFFPGSPTSASRRCFLGLPSPPRTWKLRNLKRGRSSIWILGKGRYEHELGSISYFALFHLNNNFNYRSRFYVED